MIPPVVDPAFAWRQTPSGPALVCVPLERHAPHLFTSRPWRLGLDPHAGPAGWAEVARALDAAPDAFVRMRQVHGDAVVDGDTAPTIAHDDLAPGDIVIARGSDRVVAVQGADCVPLLLVDARTGTVAAVHAGWRGMAARAPEAAVQALLRSGSRPDDLVAALGPSVGACCYEVGTQVRAAFESAQFTPAQVSRWFHTQPMRDAANPPMAGLPAPPRPEHWYLDGWAVVEESLASAGLRRDCIHSARVCTASHPEWLCSYRRDGGAAGRIAGAIRRPAPRRS
jgi:YfiH family protein